MHYIFLPLETFIKCYSVELKCYRVQYQLIAKIYGHFVRKTLNFEPLKENLHLALFNYIYFFGLNVLHAAVVTLCAFSQQFSTRFLVFHLLMRFVFCVVKFLTS